jgi:diguanylate cyclase (GGDEF)-like protein
MLHTHLKQGLRLNRTVGFALLGIEVLLLLTLRNEAAPTTGWSLLRVTLMALLTTTFLVVNELGLKALKRHPQLDDLAMEKVSLLVPMVSCGLVSALYMLSGQTSILLFSTIVLLQAEFYGHKAIARMMLVFFGLLYLITLPLGYPQTLGFAAGSAPWIPAQAKTLLMLLPFCWALGHFGAIVSSLVRTTYTRVSKLQSLAATDALTGLINRRQFNHQLDAELARARRYRKPLSLALFDIDDFKKINDFYGHPTGDRILKELGALITVNVRESDIPARYGGEEFALILPETSQIDAHEILERLRAMVEHTVFCLPDNPMTITISVGVAQLDPEQPKSFVLIENADAALYEAKRQGKNQVIYGILPTPKISYPPFGNP